LNAQEKFTTDRIFHWNKVASLGEGARNWGRAYHNRLFEIYRQFIPENQRVIELGCGKGDLLAALKPACGIGIDFSPMMIKKAKKNHPELAFLEANVLELKFEEKFDYVILSDLLNDLWDVQEVLNQTKQLCHAKTRILVNTYSRLWSPVFTLASGLGMSKPTLQQNWLTVEDIRNMLGLAGFEVIQTGREILFPLPIPGISEFCNRFLVKLWPFHYAALTNILVARQTPPSDISKRKFSVSVIVPARNEAGNIQAILKRVPQMGSGTELIFVEGNSKDNTLQVINDEIKKPVHKNVQIYKQSGKGKGDAVRLGFQKARGDILMILDADLTVAPEDLPRFYNAIIECKGDFINGVRLVYPMEREAMRFFNFLGNKFFSLAFSWLLGQPVKDTLCGTKVLWKSDVERIAKNRAYFGDFDPFGDFDLLFGAAKLGLKIVDMPIRYHERTYGTTNIQRWKHGWLLLKMIFFAADKIKFR
jgi:ubiquinone/menaquinone biosynthesis C-methylase UbiE